MWSVPFIGIRSDMTIAERYQTFLNMSDEALMFCVDLYNAGNMTWKSMVALEAIEGCDGPGDAVAS